MTAGVAGSPQAGCGFAMIFVRLWCHGNGLIPSRGVFTLRSASKMSATNMKTREEHIEFVEARGDAPKALQPPERPLDLVAPLVQLITAFPWIEMDRN